MNDKRAIFIETKSHKMTIVSNHKELVDLARERRASKIPAEYIIPADKLPDPQTLSVIDFPQKSGFFTTKELEITEVSATL
jgi:amidase